MRNPATNYLRFKRINGKHPFKQSVPDGFVDYGAKKRHGGKVFYFNFELAKEMGLMPKNHPEKLNSNLSKAILNTFSIQIINEYDIIHKTPVAKKDQLAGKYMATRYLQMQHPDKTGRTSGDGRGIWNGYFETANSTWDISSCGTGATALSPATATQNKFFKTGDKNVSYGCGLADLVDGIYTTIMSEIFHKNDIPTERTLAVISFDDSTSINVRASKNLLRPAHFFHHVKQSNFDGLKQVVEYHISRQMKNEKWPKFKTNKDKYNYFLEKITESFACTTARFEIEYIFCWLDWDGDNILMDCGIIDYGSIRQFGLFHNDYRFDDVERFSTTITEQKNKAKYIIQTFAQIADFLTTGKKKPIEKFSQHKSLKLFDKIFESTKSELMLYKTGFNQHQIDVLLSDTTAKKHTANFRKACAYFEHVKSVKGPHKVVDGITWDAVFSLRDILREMPDKLLQGEIFSDQEFLDIMKSKYASKKDMEITPGRHARIADFKKIYSRLINRYAALSGKETKTILKGVSKRSAIINRYDRITGNAMVYIAQRLSRFRNKITQQDFQAIIDNFVYEQTLKPESRKSLSKTRQKEKTEKIFNGIMDIVHTCRDEI